MCLSYIGSHKLFNIPWPVSPMYAVIQPKQNFINQSLFSRFSKKILGKVLDIIPMNTNVESKL